MEEKLAQLKAKIEAEASLLEKMFSLETPEEVQSLLKGEGIKFSLDEIQMIKEALIKGSIQGDANGELSDDELENVAGGAAFQPLVNFVNDVVDTGNAIVDSIRRARW